MSASKPNRSLTRAKRSSFRVLAVALSLLACFLCLEIGLRVWGPEYHRFGERRILHDEVLDGDRSFTKYVNEYYSNPRGYFGIRQDPEGRVIYGVEIDSVEPPFRRIPEHLEKAEVSAFLAREDTILVLGDSFTMGQGVRFEDTYARLLEILLAREGKRIGIKNTGVFGYDLEEICMSYEWYSAEHPYPLVIYGFVLNDFGLASNVQIVGSDYIDTNNGENKHSPWRKHCASFNFLCRRIETIRLDRMTKTGYLEAFKGENANNKFNILRALDRKIQSESGRLVIVLFPLLHEFHDYPFQEIHDTMHRFCQENDIPLLDLLPAFRRHTAESLWVHPTDYHPNEIAHQIAAEEIDSFLQDQGLLEALVAGER